MSPEAGVFSPHYCPPTGIYFLSYSSKDQSLDNIQCLSVHGSIHKIIQRMVEYIWHFKKKIFSLQGGLFLHLFPLNKIVLNSNGFNFKSLINLY